MNSVGSDRAVQETNNDAQMTKLSAVLSGYYDDPFLHYFARVESRKSPLINLGTFTRVCAVYDTVDSFLNAYNGEQVRQIISLGAGFDTLYMQLRRKNKIRDTDRFVDIDFAEVVADKIGIIRANEELLDVVDPDRRGKDIKEIHGFSTESYTIAGVDLSNIPSLHAAISNVPGLILSAPTLILAEVVLIYLEANASDAVIKYFSNTFRHVVFFNFEQVNPNDAFGMQMTKNIQARGCPLRGILAYPSVKEQARRFLTLGFDNVKAISMLEYYNRYLKEDEKAYANKIEPLDEFEEFSLLLNHYCILWATFHRVTEGTREGMNHVLPCPRVPVHKSKPFSPSIAPG